MNPPEHFFRDEALDEAAAVWLCERDEGFSPARARAFAAWREQDPRHAAALRRVEQTWALLAAMPAVREPLRSRFGAEGHAASPAETLARRRAFHPAWAVGLAAVLAVVAGRWWLSSAPTADAVRVSTPAASHQRLALQDGSVVDLNSGSDLRIEFSRNERRVVLSDGEAHFQVAHDPARPFVVEAGGVSVRALGTAFNVRLGVEAVDVLVVEGTVEVARGPSSGLDAEPSPKLQARERTSVPRADSAPAPKVEKVDDAVIRTELAWQDRITRFSDVPLRELVARFNRCNALQLVLEDAGLGERRIGGVIALDQVEAFVRLLERDGDVVAERRESGVIALRRAP